MPVFLSGYCLNSFLTLITMLGHPWYHWNCSPRGYSWPPNCWIKCDFPFLNSFECSAVTDVKHSCFLKHSPIVISDTTLFSFHIYLFNNPLSTCFDRHCSQIIGVLQGSTLNSHLLFSMLSLLFNLWLQFQLPPTYQWFPDLQLQPKSFSWALVSYFWQPIGRSSQKYLKGPSNPNYSKWYSLLPSQFFCFLPVTHSLSLFSHS